LTIPELQRLLAGGESQTVEFKTWIHTKSPRERVQLAVKELVAFANAQGGTLFFGVEDDGKVTGCTHYDCQALIEAIYDRTLPPLFTDYEILHHPDGDILAIHVSSDGTTYATTDGRCFKRLGKNSKPFYPSEMSHLYSIRQTPDFSSRIIVESSLEDIDSSQIAALKEKIRVRVPESTLPDTDDIPFLKDLELIRQEAGKFRLTVAGLLFVGKETSLQQLLPQAEVIYLHYSKSNPDEYDARMDMKLPILTILDRISHRIQMENRITNVQIGLFRLEIEDFPLRVVQEALLNALAHRDYQSLSSIYVRHYPDRIVIESPGGLPEGVTLQNIITHASTPRNKLIAETLQRLKYVQRTGQGVDIIYRDSLSYGKPYPEYHISADEVALTLYSKMESPAFVHFIVSEQEAMQQTFPLADLMTLRYLKDHPKQRISKIAYNIKNSVETAQKSCNRLRKEGLIELSGKSYILSAKSWDAMKDSMQYTRDKSISYIKSREMISDYLASHRWITNSQIQELCGFTKQQARVLLDKMRAERILLLEGKGRASHYILNPARKNSKKTQ